MYVSTLNNMGCLPFSDSKTIQGMPDSFITKILDCQKSFEILTV